jgi:hypothetical protein
MALMKKLALQAAKNDRIWSLFDSMFVKTADYAKWIRECALEERNPSPPTVEAVFMAQLTNLEVKHGPFQGMQYPEIKAIGSSLVPKIIGSYERELHPTIEQICTYSYDAIVDIGCAEGYYAVGLAMRLPEAIIYAYDTDLEAIRLCQSMAKLNRVADRVVTGGFCTLETLKALPLGKRALIISDCEGYEKELFNAEAVSVLAAHDLLIEMHDFHDIEISATIRKLFQDSHTIHVIKSVDDIEKAHTYEYEELTGYDLASRRLLLAEERPTIMNWCYMTPKTV